MRSVGSDGEHSRWPPRGAAVDPGGEECGGGDGDAGGKAEGIRGTAFGWYNLATGVSAIPAGLLFGWIWEEIGAPYAFGFSACIAIAATTLLATWVYRGTPWRQS